MIRSQRVPRFFGLRIFAVALLLYFALAASVFVILGIQTLPGLVARYPGLLQAIVTAPERQAPDGSPPDSLPTRAERREEMLDAEFAGAARGPGQSVLILHLVLVPIVTIFGAIAVTLPYKRYMKILRRAGKMPPRLREFCRRTIRWTPIVYAGLVLLPHLILGITISAGLLAGVAYPEVTGTGSRCAMWTTCLPAKSSRRPSHRFDSGD